MAGRVGAWGLELPARSVSVCWLLLFERATSVLSGSAMCEVEDGGAAAAEDAPPWGASGCGFVARGAECVRVLSPVASAPLRWGLPLISLWFCGYLLSCGGRIRVPFHSIY